MRAYGFASWPKRNICNPFHVLRQSYASLIFQEYGNTSIFTHDIIRSNSMNGFAKITGKREKLIRCGRGSGKVFAICYVLQYGNADEPAEYL